MFWHSNNLTSNQAGPEISLIGPFGQCIGKVAFPTVAMKNYE